MFRSLSKSLSMLGAENKRSNSVDRGNSKVFASIGRTFKRNNSISSGREETPKKEENMCEKHKTLLESIYAVSYNAVSYKEVPETAFVVEVWLYVVSGGHDFTVLLNIGFKKESTALDVLGATTRGDLKHPLHAQLDMLCVQAGLQKQKPESKQLSKLTGIQVDGVKKKLSVVTPYRCENECHHMPSRDRELGEGYRYNGHYAKQAYSYLTMRSTAGLIIKSADYDVLCVA